MGDLLTLVDELVTRLEKEIASLRSERDLWKERWEAERADHERTIKHCDDVMNEGSR